MLPEKFLARMKCLLKEEYPSFLNAIEEKNVRAMRVNPVKAEPSVIKNAFEGELSSVPYASDAFVFDIERIGNHPLHHAGAFYVQDPGAMATLHALPIEKGWCVADFCAAPGGKTTQLAAYVGESGFVLANEFDHGRCKILAGNLERLGVKNTLLTSTDTATLSSWFSSVFDLVLVDAPCSGEGMFRKYDYAQTEWSAEAVLSLASLQAEILDNAASTVKGGGYLLYSTCTFSLEENEMNVDAFLERHPDFSVQPISSALLPYTAEGVVFEGARHPEALKHTRRFYPHVAMGEGQFIALFKKKENGERPRFTYADAAVSLNKAEEKLVYEFLKNVLTHDGFSLVKNSFSLVKHKESVFLKKSFPFPPRFVYMPGVCLGEITKGRIEPHHQFFSAFGDLFIRKEMISLESDALTKYLRGETFETALSNGYAAVLADGCALGGIKAVNGIAKNHYPKGLRLH